MPHPLDPIPHAERLEQPILAREVKMVEAMIRYTCCKKHGTTELCNDCAELLHYAKKRLAVCPFQTDKPTCAKCKIHCYRAAEREKIREVMRTAGPSMLFSHPLLAIEHLIKSFKTAPQKPRNPKSKKSSS